MSKEHDRLLGSLEAKLDDLHDDVKNIREDVETLKKDFIQRSLAYKVLGWVVGIGTTVITILFNFFIMHSRG